MSNKHNKKDYEKNPKNKKNITAIIGMLVVCLLITILFSSLVNRYKNGNQETITYSEFLEMLDKKEVKSVVVGDSKIKVTPKEQKNPLMDTTYVVLRVSDYQLTDRLKEAGVKFEEEDTGSSMWLSVLATYVLPFLMIYGVMFFIMRSMGKGGGVMGVGKSNAKVYVEKKTGVTFDDVAGQDEAKESLTEMVDFLHNPGKYLKIGAKLPKGALLVGPPGTGKTLLAKAVAGEANVPFFSLSGSDFVEMFVGVGASRVRDLFKQAQGMAPCIIFIDEIDAIGKSRDSRYGGGNDEREQTLNALLAEMDGFDTSKGLVILAATNRPEVLDKALLRPGRFDRRVIVERPDLKGRVETLKVHAKNVLMDETVDFDEIALATSGAVGSDLANMINEAALGAVKAGRQAVSQKDLMEAVEIVIAGKEKKDRILNDQEKKIVSYHEVGHALCIAVQKHTEPVQKITIVPRTMGALGYTMQVPEEEHYLMSKEQILSDLVTFCGGRAAEQEVFHSVTTGASNDIERATAMARSMVTMYGMSDRFGLVGLESIQNRYLDGRSVMNCSETTGAAIDEEVQKIMKNAYDQALKIVSEYRNVLDKAAEFLIEKETITGKEFMEIFNRETKKDETESIESSAKEEGLPVAESDKAEETVTAESDKAEETATAESDKAEETATAESDKAEETVTAGQIVGEENLSADSEPVKAESTITDSEEADTPSKDRYSQLTAEDIAALIKELKEK